MNNATVEDVENAYVEDEVCKSDFGLQIIMVGVFTTTVWVDMVETVYMMIYVARIPQIPFLVKALIQISIYIPKLLIVEFLWYYGCGFLTMSKGMSELILNAVGLNFINQIDNYVYTGMIPKHMQTGMEKLNKVPLVYKIRSPLLHWLTNAMHLLAIPLIIVGTFAAVLVLPFSCPVVGLELTKHWDAYGRFWLTTLNLMPANYNYTDAADGMGEL